MRTIKKTFLTRLAAQAQEAEVQGLTKVADALTSQIEKNSDHIRKNEEFYVYSEKDVKADIQDKFWDIIVRIADYYDTNIDAKEMQALIDKAADDILNDVRVKLGINHGIGAYEPNVPGEEIPDRVTIELEEEDNE